MRNLLWLLVIVGLLGVWFRYQGSGPKPGSAEEFGLTWQDWEQRPHQVFIFSGDQNISKAFFANAGRNPKVVTGRGLQELFAKLQPEIPVAMEEPCQGDKAQELTLFQGAQIWTVTIGTRPGEAQQRIRNIMYLSGSVNLLRGQVP